MNKVLLFFLAVCAPSVITAFSGIQHQSFLISASSQAAGTSTSLNAFFKGKEYNKVVENLMLTKGLTREEAEQDYNAYLENPTNYALSKGEAYYQGLGYKSLMEGVVGEAEKEGRGDEVRDRIESFRKKSQLKATGVLIVVFASFLYAKSMYPLELTNGSL